MAESTLLQVNNRGWEVELFEDQNNIIHALCFNCGAVCRDPVELGCEHDDSAVFLHCFDCLSSLIYTNDGNCPVNNHSNPRITKNIAMKRLIAKSIVLCPYSVEYKQRNIIKENNNDNHRVIDTPGADEKEGPITGCRFKGPMNDLLQNHISECIKIYNPSYIQNLTIKKLKQENMELNDKCMELQNKLVRRNEQFEELQKQLSAAKDKINTLQLQLEQKTKDDFNFNYNAEMKQETSQTMEKHDECLTTLYHSSNLTKISEFWRKSGSNIKIDGTTIFYAGRKTHTANSSVISAPGLHEFKFKITKNKNCWIYIGITTARDCLNDYYYQKPGNCAYKSSGHKFDQMSNSKQRDYGQSYDVDDIITLNLDFNNQNISFKHNGTDLGVLSRISKLNYYVAVCIYGGVSSGSAAVEIVSMRNKI